MSSFEVIHKNKIPILGVAHSNVRWLPRLEVSNFSL